jgi:hypothetical protein
MRGRNPRQQAGIRGFPVHPDMHQQQRRTYFKWRIIAMESKDEKNFFLAKMYLEGLQRPPASTLIYNGHSSSVGNPSSVAPTAQGKHNTIVTLYQSSSVWHA